MNYVDNVEEMIRCREIYLGEVAIAAWEAKKIPRRTSNPNSTRK